MKKGFTMIELIFVIVILGVLAAVAIPKLNATRDDAEVAKAATNLATLVGDLTSYYTSKGHFEDDLSVMTNVPLANIVKKVPKLSEDEAKKAVLDALVAADTTNAADIKKKFNDFFQNCIEKSEADANGDIKYTVKTDVFDDVTPAKDTNKPKPSQAGACNKSVTSIGDYITTIQDKIAGQGAAADYMIKNAKCATFTVNINSGAIDIAIDAAASKICLRAFEQNASTYGLAKPVTAKATGSVKVIGSSVKF